jgi:hypothetical protein
LAEVSGFSIRLANEEKLSNLIDTYFLENDQVRLYFLFVTGSEVVGDRIQLRQGAIENFPFSLHEFALQVIDDSDRNFRAIPAQIVEQTTFPNAPYDRIGKPLPLPFGRFEDVFRVNSEESFFLAPAVNVHLFDRLYTTCADNVNTLILDTYIYRWYPDARQFAKWSGLDPVGVGRFFELNGSSFTAKISPVLDMPTNNLSTWRYACDGKESTAVIMVNGEDLDLYMGGFPKRGSLSSGNVVIISNNTAWSYVVRLRGTIKASGAATLASMFIPITTADHADDWDFEQYTIEIDATGNTQIKEVYLDFTFDDQEALGGALSSMQIFALCQGFQDFASHYRDGAVVFSSGNTIENCVDVVHAILRAKVALNLPVAAVNVPSFTAAKALRSNWNLAFSLQEQVGIEWLNTLCFESGLSLFLSDAGQWSVVARATGRAPNHILFHGRDIVVKNKDLDPSQWDYDFRVSRTPMRDIINEIALRYRLERASEQYIRFKGATGHYRSTGTNAVVVALTTTTGTLTSSGATFVTSGAVAGDIAYVWGHLTYTVTSVDSETQLTISGTEVYADTGRTYYVGANIDPRMVRSQVRYKTESPLGVGINSFAEDAGYTSQLIHSDTTAQLLINHLATFRAFTRLVVELGTFWNAANMELGDITYLDHPWLPTERRPFLVSAVSGAHTSGTTTLTVTAGTGELFQVGDFLLIGSEVLTVTALIGVNSVTVSRGQLTSAAAAYVGGESIRRCETKWEIIGIKPDPLIGQWRLELEELPLDYTRIGMVVADGYPSYAAATTDQITVSGWALENSGRALESDENSSISYAI